MKRNSALKNDNWQMRTVSLLMIAILLMQSVALFKPIRRATWPFINYPMYKTPHYEGDNLGVEYLVFAELADGNRIRILPRDVGLNWFKFYYIARCLAYDPPNACARNEGHAQRLAEMLEPKTNKKVIRFISMSYPAILTRDGVQSAESEVVGIVRLVDQSKDTE